ncbi:MAG: hypothetical protein ACI932_001925, partial [Paracoccaceae bacterium]
PKTNTPPDKLRHQLLRLSLRLMTEFLAGAILTDCDHALALRLSTIIG